MCEESPLPTVLDLLSDEHARAILTETSVEPMSAKTLSERCDASLPTVYRRIDQLTDCGLLDERTRPRRDGNHTSVYTARLQRFAVALDDGEFTATLERVDGRADDVADRFTRMWEDL
ncbi:helix-turn-helix domain-containing protein [Halomarina oriensis]|uniref:Helix-turn-helix domain-containing protein n=1 Tax=Halomarina oriensis TaxID=671145 RepID=A0A6B0GPZ1_9EURY|nr:helix-turn-helix domain-containing protein [Halomarina oriensis]